MSIPKQRRRVVLPILLAAGLTVVMSVVGYLYFSPNGAQLDTHAKADLDAGFESAQVSDGLSEIASAWQTDSPPAADLADSATEEPTPQESAEEPVQTAAAVTPLPIEESTDRYASLEPANQHPPAAEQAPAELEPFGDVADDEPQEALSDALAATELPPLASDEPHSASETLARGQSPSGDLPPIEALPGDNPLRASQNRYRSNDAQPQPSATAEEAFAQAAPLPMDSGDGYRELSGSLPTTLDAENPLRPMPQSAPEPAASDAQPQPADFGDARPMAASRYGDLQQHQSDASQPLESLDPLPNEPQQAEDAFAESPQGGFDSAELTPVESGRQSTSLEPSPSSRQMGTPAIDDGTGRPGERALEGPQRPALVVQKFAPEEIQVGKECKFVIKVRNVGQRPADNVVVEDEVPQGTRFVSASPQAESSGATLKWPLGTLSPGEERTMEIELMPTEEGEIGSVAQVTFASHASAKSRCTRPQIALRMTAPSEVLVGRQQRITIELHNPGTGDATGVVLLENVPENVRHQAGPALEFEVGTLRAGETRRMELVLTAEKPGHVVNVLTARADGNLQVQQDVEFEVIAPAIAVGVDGPSRRYLERPATYTVSIDNPGTAPAKDVQVVTKLPKGMQFVRANNLGEYDSATHSVYWSLAELPQGQKGSVELVAMPVQSGDHVIEVEGRAREGLEDRTTREVHVEGLAAIMFTVSDSQDPIEIGGTTSYDIRVVNQGSKAASNLRVTALVPSGMTVTGASGETRHSIEAEGVVFEPLERLAPKADTVYRVDVQGVKPGDQRLLVEVRTDEITQPIRKEESTRIFGDE